MAAVHPSLADDFLSDISGLEEGQSEDAKDDEGGPTRQEMEIAFVMENIDNRLESLKKDEIFQKHKLVLFTISFVFLLGGVTLILFGLRVTVFFEKFNNQPINIPALAFGSLFCLPIFAFYYYLCFPNRIEKRKRKKIHRDRRARRKKTLFNQLVEEARKATEPPPRRIRVLAHVRKHDYPIIASTMQEFTDAVADQVGLTVERQLLRFNDKDLVIELDKKLDEYYGMDNGSRIFIYNKGGYVTMHSPLKNSRVDIITELNRDREGSRHSRHGGTASSDDGRKSRTSAVSKVSAMFTRNIMSRSSFRSSFRGSNYDEEDDSLAAIDKNKYKQWSGATTGVEWMEGVQDDDATDSRAGTPFYNSAEGGMGRGSTAGATAAVNATAHSSLGSVTSSGGAGSISVVTQFSPPPRKSLNNYHNNRIIFGSEKAATMRSAKYDKSKFLPPGASPSKSVTGAGGSVYSIGHTGSITSATRSMTTAGGSSSITMAQRSSQTGTVTGARPMSPQRLKSALSDPHKKERESVGHASDSSPRKKSARVSFV